MQENKIKWEFIFLKGNDWQAELNHFSARVAIPYYLYVQMCNSAVMKVLQGFHDVSNVESYFFFHQLIMIHKVVQESAIIHPEKREEKANMFAKGNMFAKKTKK